MLKTTRLSDLVSRELRIDEVVGGGGKADEMVMDLFKSPKKKKKKRRNIKSQKTSKT